MALFLFRHSCLILRCQLDVPLLFFGPFNNLGLHSILRLLSSVWAVLRIQCSDHGGCLYSLLGSAHFVLVILVAVAALLPHMLAVKRAPPAARLARTLRGGPVGGSRGPLIPSVYILCVIPEIQVISRKGLGLTAPAGLGPINNV